MPKIGELFVDSGEPLIKMWDVFAKSEMRPFVKHSHTRFEITVVNSGTGEYSTENARYPMAQGDIFVFSSNEVHCITKIGEGGLSITNFHLEPRYLSGEFTKGFGDGYINFCFSHSDKFENRIPAEKATVLRMHHNAIREEFLNKNEQYELSIRAHLHLMLIELLREHNYRAHTSINSSVYSMLSVYDYINKHLGERIELKTLADIAGMSPNYFSSLFKKLNGITLWDYITAKRIEKAVSLIRKADQNVTILDIALQCGFNNTVSFNKAFKKHKGFTPSDLRRNPKLLSY